MNITLVTIDNKNYELTEFAIEKTLQNIKCNKILIFSDQNFLPQYDFVPISKELDLLEYNQLVLKDINQYIETEYVLIVQWDGFAVKNELWSDNFLEQDYIGAPWWDNIVGNGGFSLRSKKLLNALQDPEIQITSATEIAEDVAICRTHRSRLENQHQIKFSPLALADQFSVEHRSVASAFGFHGMWNATKFLNDQDIKFFIDRLPENFLSHSNKVRLFVNSLNVNLKNYFISKVNK